MSQFWRIIKKIPLTKPIYTFLKRQIVTLQNYIQNYLSYNKLKRVSNYHNHHLPIKVGFLTQVPECWQKTEPIFKEMIKREEFEVYVIQVPPFDIIKNKVGDYSKENEYFENLVDKKHTIKYEDFDLSSVDYLFYQRPYDPVYPNKLKSKNASKYTKLCYIPYGPDDVRNFGTKPLSFFRNLSISFLEDSCNVALVKAKFNSKFNFRYNRFVNIGYPSFEQMLKLEKKEKVASTCRILWTPRWSYSPIIGGSHFFEYVNFITSMALSSKITLTIRPHPLMWENFLKEKLITIDQINKYKTKWNELNITLDNNQNVLDTFKRTDILISDTSSIVLMFFLTNKPIIFCKFNSADYSELFKKILPGMYLVNTQEELKKTINNLIKGIDPKKNIRDSIINEFSYHKSATYNIVEFIEKDYIENNFCSHEDSYIQ